MSFGQEYNRSGTAQGKSSEEQRFAYEKSLNDQLKEVKIPSIRENLLSEAKSLTAGDRDREYGDPMVNLQCATQLKVIFWSHQGSTGRLVSEAEREAIDMVLTKLSRLACGPTAKVDTFVDGAAYFAIAGEAFIKQKEGQLPPARSHAFSNAFGPAFPDAKLG